MVTMLQPIKKGINFALCTLYFALASCAPDTELVSLGIDDEYVTYRMQKLKVASAYTGQSYRWTWHRDDGTDSILSDKPEHILLFAEEGTYKLSFDVFDSQNPYHHDFTVYVLHEETEYSAYISKVHEYRPAPGQFINTMPQYDEGNDYEDILAKVNDCITGTSDVMISLGAWGGYCVFGFDHTVVNREGYDFAIYGNAFYDLSSGDENPYGSCEPGIVYVSYDENMNGEPDDTWYELAGSEFTNSATIFGYSITYTAPDPTKAAVTDRQQAWASDLEYIPWVDNQGESGFVAKNIFHTQSYYPQWLIDNTLTFSGSRLPGNAVDLSGRGTYVIQYAAAWGYVDNHPVAKKDLNSFDISWARDALGQPVNLPGVDFIKVMTGVNQYCGSIGETSTEFSKAIDLNISD